MDELFTRYMYYERAKLGIKSSTTEALRRFYERDSYALLKNDKTMDNLIELANFWNDISIQNSERFSDRILKKLFVLNYAPNGMWNYFVSVFFMQYKDNKGLLDDEKFYNFLNKIIPFIWTYAVINPGVNALRTPVYLEMVNIVNNKDVEFNEFKFEELQVRNALSNYEFYNRRPITKSMLAWWAFNNTEQELVSIDDVFEIEHIYPKNRQENEKGLQNSKNIETLGNKSLLEKRINIRASDYRFSDKYKYYNGFVTDRGAKKEKTAICDLIKISNIKNDFTEQDIVDRNNEIINEFICYLRDEKLFK